MEIPRETHPVPNIPRQLVIAGDLLVISLPLRPVAFPKVLPQLLEVVRSATMD